MLVAGVFLVLLPGMAAVVAWKVTHAHFRAQRDASGDVAAAVDVRERLEYLLAEIEARQLRGQRPRRPRAS